MSPADSKQRLNVIIAFAMVYVLWGSTFLAIRVLVSHVPPTIMGTTRFLAAGPIMLAICAVMGKKIAINRRDFLLLGAMGILLLSGGNVVVGWAEMSVPSGLAALI